MEAVFPKTTIQLSLVHMARHSMPFVGWKQCKEMAGDCNRFTAQQPSGRRNGGLPNSRPNRMPPMRRLACLGAATDHACHPFPTIHRTNLLAMPIVLPNAIETGHINLRKITKTRARFRPTGWTASYAM
jgi:putative transposase